jgi:hypothetical protein
MLRRGLTLTAAGAALALLAARPASAADAPAHQFVGVEKCAKMCHNDEKTGAQLTKWQASAHAKAYAELASDKAKEVAKAKGIADPQKAAECLACHVTGHGAPAASLADTYKVEDGVGCESCHGAGGDYKKLAVMKDHAKAVEAGLKVPTEETCKGCHNEKSPTYKPFDYKERLAKIAHPNPEKGKTKG